MHTGFRQSAATGHASCPHSLDHANFMSGGNAPQLREFLGCPLASVSKIPTSIPAMMARAIV